VSYGVKIIVYTTDDPRVLQSVRQAVESDGAKVQEFTPRTTETGDQEVYVELQIPDPKVFAGILRRVEAVKGAAIMAATEPGKAPRREGSDE
jgi:(p)ppGpp synthase/HD superfamily hydrolase